VARVRLDRRATSISLLVVLGIRRDGQKLLLAVRNMGGESEAAWRSLLDGLITRGLKPPEFVIVDGAPGLEKALGLVWPQALVQRCTVHQHRNLGGHGGNLWWHSVERGRCEFGHRLGLHIAVLELPFVVGLSSTAPIRRTMAPSLGKIPTTSARRLTSLFSRSSGFVEWILLRCWMGKSMCASTSASLSSMNAPSFGHLARSWSATGRNICLTAGRSGWINAWRSAAETMLCWPLGT
jgi:hypothetical protein